MNLRPPDLASEVPRYGIPFLETSAWFGENVNEAGGDAGRRFLLWPGTVKQAAGFLETG